MLGANPRILLLDDEPDMANKLIPWLKMSGIEVVYRRGPAEVMDALNNEAEHFDVLVLDMMMPGSHGDDDSEEFDDPDPVETGIELHREIRSNPRLRDIPIIFLSVVRDAGVRNAVRTEEAKYAKPGKDRLYFMSKPVLAADLIDRIRKVARSS